MANLYARLALILCVTLSLASGIAHASPQLLVNDDEDDVYGGGEENRFDPVLLPLDNGRLLALWIDNSTGQTDVRGRVLNAQLEPDPDVEPQVINDSDGYWFNRGVIVSSGGGGRAVAVWMDGRHGDDDVYAQSIATADGSRIGANRHLNDDSGLGHQDAPAAATGGDGRSLVCWMDNRSGHYRVWGQILDAAGQPSGGNRHLSPENPERTQGFPAVAALPDLRWLLAWSEEIDGVNRVRYRILESDGTAVDPIHTTGEAETFDQDEPTILVRASDALIAWIDDREASSDLWGRWVDHAGNALTAPSILRAATDTSRDDAPSLVAGPGGSFALTWFGAVETRQRPFVRFFGADRAPLSGDLPMSDPPGPALARPGSAAALSGGTWIVAWSDDRDYSLQVYAVAFDPTTGPVGQPRAVWSVPGSASQIFADVAFFPDGRAIVVWGDLRYSTLSYYARFLDAQGWPEGESFLVNASPIEQRTGAMEGIGSLVHLRPSVAASQSGFIVTWAANITGGRLALWAQLFDAEGRQIGDNFRISPDSSAPQFDARPAMAADGRFVIAWRDDVNDPLGDVLVQRFSAAGQRIGTPLQVADTQSRPFPQESPSVSVSAYNDMVVAFIDRRGGGYDVYIQRYTLDGVQIGQNTLQHLADGPGFDQIHPSVATNGEGTVTVWEDQSLTLGWIRGRIEVLESLAPGAGRPAETFIDFLANEGFNTPGLKYPSVRLEPSGRFVVVWGQNAQGRTSVWARRFDINGMPIGVAYQLDGGDTPEHRTFARASVNGEDIQYVWTDSRRARGWDIFSRRVSWDFNGDATPIALNYWEADAAPRGVALRWSVPLSGAAPGFLLWRDIADGSFRTSPGTDASLLTAEPISPVSEGLYEYLDETAPAGETLHYYLEARGPSGSSEFYGPLEARWDAPVAGGWMARPSPFRSKVEFLAPAPGATRLEICDVSGRTVRTLHGDGTLIWDGLDDRGRAVRAGVYFARPPRGGAPIRVIRVR